MDGNNPYLKRFARRTRYLNARLVADRHMKCLELYSGIGGFAVVARKLGWRVARAVDINQLAACVYELNFGLAPEIRTIESLTLESDAHFDLWWMSPPCQPFTRRGARRDQTDLRTQSFLHVLELIERHQPRLLALENVPEFARSETADAFRRTLSGNGYRWQEQQLCSTDFGLPNRRKRFFVSASREHEPELGKIEQTRIRPLSEFLETSAELVKWQDKLRVHTDELNNWRRASDLIQLAEGMRQVPVTACFTSAYGKSPVQSGSWLWQDDVVRRFSPREILRLLGFPDRFALTSQLTLRQQWKLVGNSLSLPCVEHVLSSLLCRPNGE